jgi:hypothetical protein
MHAGVKRMSQLANQVNGSQQIERADFTAEGPELDPRYTDDGAVQLVIQDTQRASTFLEKKQWNLFWREADVLYQSPRTNTTFEGSTVARANVSRFTVAQHVYDAAAAVDKAGHRSSQDGALRRPSRRVRFRE